MYLPSLITYLSKDSTNAIKGIFILLVFIRHANQYVSQAGYEYASIGDRMFLMVDGLLAQLIVVMFLFFSGYGIMCSINHGGQNYIRSIPKRRLLNTLINFDVAVLFYVGIAYVVNDSLVLKQVLLSLVGWDSVGNSNWYICVILICYLSTYISFLIAITIKSVWLGCNSNLIVLLSKPFSIVSGSSRNFVSNFLAT